MTAKRVSTYYYSMTCPRTENKKGNGQTCYHACNLDCHFLGVDEYRKYYCKWPGKGHIINGRRDQ